MDINPRRKRFLDHFSSDEGCAAYVRMLRWPDGFRCLVPGCSGDGSRVVARLNKRLVHVCNICGAEVSLTAGTALHGTTPSLLQWFAAIQLMARARFTTTIVELQSQVGLNSFTIARSMHQRITDALNSISRRPMVGRIRIHTCQLPIPRSLQVAICIDSEEQVFLSMINEEAEFQDVVSKWKELSKHRRRDPVRDEVMGQVARSIQRWIRHNHRKRFSREQVKRFLRMSELGHSRCGSATQPCRLDVQTIPLMIDAIARRLFRPVEPFVWSME